MQTSRITTARIDWASPFFLRRKSHGIDSGQGWIADGKVSRMLTTKVSPKIKPKKKKKKRKSKGPQLMKLRHMRSQVIENDMHYQKLISLINSRKFGNFSRKTSDGFGRYMETDELRLLYLHVGLVDQSITFSVHIIFRFQPRQRSVTCRMQPNQRTLRSNPVLMSSSYVSFRYYHYHRSAAIHLPWKTPTINVFAVFSLCWDRLFIFILPSTCSVGNTMGEKTASTLNFSMQQRSFYQKEKHLAVSDRLVYITSLNFLKITNPSA